MNIGALTIFEGQIPFEPLMRMVDARIHQTPIYQQKLIQAPLNLGQPTWVYDPDFSIGKHVYLKHLASPGTDEQLQEMAGRIISSMLDRSKPLWEIHLIEGLSDNRSAILFKVHHCMVDGLAAIELLTLLFDLSPDISPNPRKPVYDPPPLPDSGRMILDAVGGIFSNRVKVAQKLLEDAGEVTQVLSDREKRRKLFMGMANIVNDNLTLLRPLPINGRNSGKQSIAWAEFSLAEVRAIKSARNASVNDVMLAILSGGIEGYTNQQGGANGQEFVRALVPVSMREERERGDFGNRISVIPVDIPFGVADPLERLRMISEFSGSMKESSLSTGLDLVLTVPALAASWVQPLVWKLAPAAFSVLAHLWSTNVAGPQIPLYLLGCQMLHTYGFFPLNPSMGLCSVTTSYNQKISINLIADTSIVPDVNDVRNHLYKAYDALRKAANIPEMAAVQIPRKPKAEVVDMAAVAAAPIEIPAASPSAPDPQNLTLTEAFSIARAAITPEPEAPAAPAAPEAEEPIELGPNGKPLFFSQGWAKAYQKVLNNSTAYRNVSKKWEAGALSFILKAAPEHGINEDSAVYLDLLRGVCNNAYKISPDEAMGKSAFVIEGDYQTWMDVLQGKAAPLGLIMRGKLRLRKGAVTKLMGFTDSATELLRAAKTIS
jgi:diacylglycerol O-acyltransferase / wax synthase